MNATTTQAAPLGATAPVPAERKRSLGEVGMDRMGTGGMLMPKSLADVVTFAQVMSRADLALPKHLRGNDGACMAVAMQALRWEMDPFAVANKSYGVNDRLAYEAQLIAAVVHTRAPIIGRPDYVYSGEGPSRRCKVVCVMSDGEVREYESPRFDQITTKNSPLWKTDPDQQLGYYSIRSWARRHTPEVLLGVYAPDEVEQMRDVTPEREPERPPSLRDRLQAQPANGQGFSEGHVARETTPGAAPEARAEPEADTPKPLETGSIPEETIQEAEFTPAEEAAEPSAPVEETETTGPEYLFEDPAEFASAAPDYIDRLNTLDDLTALWGQWQGELRRLRKSDLPAYQSICNAKNARKRELEAEAAKAEARG